MGNYNLEATSLASSQDASNSHATLPIIGPTDHVPGSRGGQTTFYSAARPRLAIAKKMMNYDSDSRSAQDTPHVTPDPSQPLVSVKAGDHLDLRQLGKLSSDILPYRLLRNLGHGGSARVEMVEDVSSALVYARKIIRNVNTRNMEQAKRQLENEVRIVKRLAAHHHIIQVHATYVLRRELAIILSPVADGGDLANFLQDYQDKSLNGDMVDLEQNRILKKSFGCLASGLAFMHRHTVRHKDIKPQNTLVHFGKVIYTDFGLSYDYGDASQSATTGIVGGHTKRYCAPEVAQGASRNIKSDVFSLGCVYIEIIAAMWPVAISGVLLQAFISTVKTIEASLHRDICCGIKLDTWESILMQFKQVAARTQSIEHLEGVNLRNWQANQDATLNVAVSPDAPMGEQQALQLRAPGLGLNNDSSTLVNSVNSTSLIGTSHTTTNFWKFPPQPASSRGPSGPFKFHIGACTAANILTHSSARRDIVGIGSLRPKASSNIRESGIQQEKWVCHTDVLSRRRGAITQKKYGHI
ncbi:kinase-like protein [Ophiobolus disseminans]|uniref:NEK6-subfamily protein kinase n=1 Tax=Ophiobolus disseminans TaxID=1469910 RepID=A0A6A6ZDH2_9PLEO|nr:kinase-like protein [Ophiobolus disseminans]